VARNPLSLLVDAGEERDHAADHRTQRDQRSLRAEHCSERERAERGEGDAGPVHDRDSASADPLQRWVAAVAGQEPARDQHDAGAY